MLIVGDFSGIQDYLLGVTAEGGGQAKRLRARSFFIQSLSEAALVRVLLATAWSQVHVCAAGKFIIEVTDFGAETEQRLKLVYEEICAWLLQKTSAHVRFSLASYSGTGNPPKDYANLMSRLQQEKLKPWAREAVVDSRWNPTSLVLEPLDTPCVICRKSRAEHKEEDSDGVIRKICRRCHEDYEIGRMLPSAKWMVLRSRNARFAAAGLGLDLQSDSEPNFTEDILAIANMKDPNALPPDLPSGVLSITRHLAAHVPVGNDQKPVEFKQLAEKSAGDRLLGVLKADGDHIGRHFNRLIERDGWEGLSKGALSLDRFFAGNINMEMSSSNSPWNDIYTVYSGGDDLLLVGPWNVILDFAGHIHRLFVREFGYDGLTFSAGITFIKPMLPIKAAAEQAELLLQLAKETGRDRVAALGQVWQWAAHDKIFGAGRMLTRWVGDKIIERGWLHTILDLTLTRLNVKKPVRERLLATSRLAYHVSRNWPKRSDRNERNKAARIWADEFVAHFDNMDQDSASEYKFLPAALRYALMATRSRLDVEQENMEGGL